MPKIQDNSVNEVDNLGGLLCIFTLAAAFTYILNRVQLNLAKKAEEKPVVTEEKIMVSSGNANVTSFDL